MLFIFMPYRLFPLLDSMIWPHPQPIRGKINMPGNKNTEYTYIGAAAYYVICPQIMPQREKSIKHIFCPVNMLKTLIQWSLTMNKPHLWQIYTNVRYFCMVYSITELRIIKQRTFVHRRGDTRRQTQWDTMACQCQWTCVASP